MQFRSCRCRFSTTVISAACWSETLPHDRRNRRLARQLRSPAPPLAQNQHIPPSAAGRTTIGCTTPLHGSIPPTPPARRCQSDGASDKDCARSDPAQSGHGIAARCFAPAQILPAAPSECARRQRPSLTTAAGFVTTGRGPLGSSDSSPRPSALLLSGTAVSAVFSAAVVIAGPISVFVVCSCVIRVTLAGQPSARGSALQNSANSHTSINI